LALAYEFLPTIAKKRNRKKIYAGYEMFGSPQRDITAEIASKRLRDLV